LTHDGQSVSYYAPDREFGISGSQLDEDFQIQGIWRRMEDSKRSQGEQAVAGIGGALESLGQNIPIEWRLQEEQVNDVWRPRLAAVRAFLAPHLKLGPPTILLDEPDRSLSTARQIALWDNLVKKAATQAQLIVATHSPFALFLPNTYYLDLNPGYLAQCENSIYQWMKHRKIKSL
jgi:hypothetical protein